MTRLALGGACLACACGSAPPRTPPPGEPAPEVAPAAASTPAPAPVDAAVPDAGPSPELLAAPAWIFRYNAPPRVETWTLRYVGGEALVVVESAQATTTYRGTATEGATLALDVASATGKVALECKHAQRAVGETCAARKPPRLDVLDCYHPDFASPMTFAPAPGVEYAASCNGYQRLRAAWTVPAGWRGEVIPFPIDFAPALAHRGVEVVRFAPGFFDPAAAGYWSYAFAWRLGDPAALDAGALAGELTTYFRGLVAAVDEKHRVADADRAQIRVTATPAVGGTGVTLAARVYDAFGSGAAVDLTGTATRQPCGGGALWLVTLGTAHTSAALRTELAELARGATCDNVHP